MQLLTPLAGRERVSATSVSSVLFHWSGGRLQRIQKQSMETTQKSSSLRWKILRQALLRRPDSQSQAEIKRISRKTTQGFNLIPCHLVKSVPSLLRVDDSREACVCYTLPIGGSPKLSLAQRLDNSTELSDFEVSNQYHIDNTGLICQWPSEDVLAYLCMSHPDFFSGKRVLELGAGYGLAGLAIAAATEASEIIISDGNPQVVDYIQRNIEANSAAFGSTRVAAMTLHWNQEAISCVSNTFDVIIASDCTFFKEFHKILAGLVKKLLKDDKPSEAIFMSPKRGDSLDKFLEEIVEAGLNFSLTENYDAEVWKRHQQLTNGDDSWPSYGKDHCYPLLIKITH